MRRLTVTGFTDDGTELLLTAEPPRSGPEAREGTYVLALDDQLWAALRQDRARLSQIQLADPAAVRPRDIQSRVRAGQSPEEVAEAAGVPVARVIAYALPVMAEREHIARTAQATTLRHRSGPPVTLGEAVRAGVRAPRIGVGTAGLGTAGPAETDPELAWDAYKRAPGGWIVEVAAPGGPARFAFDPAARSVVPDDDAARDLVAEPEPPVIGVSYDVRVTRVEAAVGVVAVPAAEPDTDDSEPTVPVTPTPAPGGLREVGGRDRDSREAGGRDSARGRRSLRYLAFRDEQVDAAGAGTSGTGSVQRAPGAPPPDADTPELGALFEAAPDPDPRSPGEDGGVRAARSARRPAVPSWDEIMFGRKDE